MSSSFAGPPAGPRRGDLPSQQGVSALLLAVTVLIVVACLYFGRDIFVPLALAILLSFALAPPVRWLRRLRVPRLPAVLLVVTLAFAVILAFGTMVTWQVADLAQRLPSYQRNIEAKIDALREAPPGGRLFGRAAEMVRDLGNKIDEAEKAEEEAEDAAPAAPAEADQEAEERAPIPVEIHQPDPTSMQLLRSIVGPLVAPLATAGIVIVLVIFMLLKREDLRDRIIRLAGPRDLSRTTEALDDAAQRVGHYLLMQLVVNATYGLPVGIGLWLIGLPNPVLWGLLATVLRFVPYIGPIIAAFFPLALAVAVDPGWNTLLMVAGLLVVIELISNNAVEPWLYGASTGLSPVAVIAAAVFWTWLWGPVGLLLSTPLTVCLIVLGQHVPQLAFLDVLLGSEPVLSPSESLYQSLLMGDPHEATERAEEGLRETTLCAYYDEVVVPALALAEHDRARGALDPERRDRVAESALLLIDNLAEYEDPPPAAGPEAGAEAAPPQSVPDGRVLVAGTRGNLDEVAAAMLEQLLEQRGVRVQTLQAGSLQSARLKEMQLDGVAVVVLSYMNADSLAHARLLIRRLRRRLPDAAMVVGLWTFPAEDLQRRDPLAATGAEKVATSLADAVTEVLDVLAADSAPAAAKAPQPA